MISVEIRQIDLRYENYRLQDRKRERQLFPSILETGIHEPLWGVSSSAVPGQGAPVILLDGFKRFRCGKKAGLTVFPFHSLASDEASGILQLLRIANARSLNLLEQARLVDGLKKVHGMGVREISKSLERSSAWVSVRLGVLTEMPEAVAKAIFAGRFPASSYLYTLRNIRRLTTVKEAELEEFVERVSGKELSTREIDLLARAFFMGGEKLREQIRSGNLAWSLEHLRNQKHSQEGGGAKEGSRSALLEVEARLLRDLEMIHKYLGRCTRVVNDRRLTLAVHAEGNLLSGGILRLLPAFSAAIQEFFKRSSVPDFKKGSSG